VEFRVGAQGGQRGAEFVAGVGEELAHAFLPGLLFLDRGVDAGEHAVEGLAEPADFGVGGVWCDRPGEVAGGDAVGLGGHGFQGTQPAPDHDEPAGGQQGDGDDCGDGQDDLEGADRVGDRAQVGRDDKDPDVGRRGA
jgi:hypothetical protein